uniref:Uncharacterized protein n=2 Tax=Oryza TaxID=4527 RepID=Q2R4T3_ORYSJ|nr:hypothetical protein LOC_Os11g27390 [Oryza sativa Japonica Group]
MGEGRGVATAPQPASRPMRLQHRERIRRHSCRLRMTTWTAPTRRLPTPSPSSSCRTRSLPRVEGTTGRESQCLCHCRHRDQVPPRRQGPRRGPASVGQLWQELAYMCDEYDHLRATRPSTSFQVFVSTIVAVIGIQQRDRPHPPVVVPPVMWRAWSELELAGLLLTTKFGKS